MNEPDKTIEIANKIENAAKDCLNITKTTTLDSRLKSLVRFSTLVALHGRKGEFRLGEKLHKLILDNISWILSNNTISIEIAEYIKCSKEMFEDINKANYVSETTFTHLAISASTLSGISVNLDNIRDSSYLYPKIIHLETQARCNAKCNFCDYQNLKRKGITMPDNLIDKILSELSEIPEDHMFSIQPYKVSEPFLETRLPSIIKRILLMHKNCTINIISNANFMPEESMNSIFSFLDEDYAWLKIGNDIKCRIFMNFSLNESTKEQYETLMKIPFEKTISNLRNLHKRIKDNNSKMHIGLSRVSTDAQGDKDFYSFCRREFPLFKPHILKMNNWTSTNQYSNSHEKFENLPINSLQKLPCLRWFDLSIMANGNIALCCMDSGENELPLGNVQTSNCLKLYREKISKYFPSDSMRISSIYPCKSCTYTPKLNLTNGLNRLIKMYENTSTD